MEGMTVSIYTIKYLFSTIRFERNEQTVQCNNDASSLSEFIAVFNFNKMVWGIGIRCMENTKVISQSFRAVETGT